MHQYVNMYILKILFACIFKQYLLHKYNVDGGKSSRMCITLFCVFLCVWASICLHFT